MRQERDIKDVLEKINNVAGNWPLPERYFIIFSMVQHPGGQGRRKHYKSGGAHRLRGTLKEFLEVRLST